MPHFLKDRMLDIFGCVVEYYVPHFPITCNNFGYQFFISNARRWQISSAISNRMVEICHMNNIID